MPYFDNITPKPSEQLAGYLSGKVSADDTPAAIKSWATFEIFKAAQQVVSGKDVGARRDMLGRVPPHIRPQVQAYVKSLWAAR